MAPSEEQKTNPLVEGLMMRRTVLLTGQINLKNVSDVAQRMLALQMRSSDPITLFIDSGGGDLDAALQLCDVMEIVMTAPVRGIAVGMCGSAATFVMLYCKERCGTPYSRFLIHSGTRREISIPINHTTSESLEQLLKDVKATEEMVLRLYTNRLTPEGWEDGTLSQADKRAYVQGLINRGDQRFDRWLSVGEAVKVGLIQKIITEKLEIFEERK